MVQVRIKMLPDNKERNTVQVRIKVLQDNKGRNTVQVLTKVLQGNKEHSMAQETSKVPSHKGNILTTLQRALHLRIPIQTPHRDLRNRKDLTVHRI